MGNLEILDKIDLKKSDPQAMISHIENFPTMCKEAFALSRHLTIPSFYIKAKKIILVGMGGSGAANDIVRDMMIEEINISIESCHNYILPAYVDSETLVIVSTFSGETEEAIAAFSEAHEKGAKILVITTGGKIKVLAEKYRVPVWTFELKACPRAAFPYLFVLLFTVFEKLGFLKLSNEYFETIIEGMEQLKQKYMMGASLFGNPAKVMAEKISNKVVVLYASEKLTSVARRIKNQINENSKNFAFVESFPELDHNAVLGLANPKNSNIYVISLESNFEQDRQILRQNITAEIVRKNKVPFERIKFIGMKDRLEETLKLVLYGDFISFYLAILNRVNPTEQDDITNLKSRLI
jgi:glucose/mannose-6-phosphate isomerase